MMLDYDVDVTFEDGSVETIKVHAVSRYRGLITAIYSLERWDFVKQNEVKSIQVRKAQLGRPKEAPPETEIGNMNKISEAIRNFKRP